MSVRVKFVIVGVLLILASGITIVAVVATIQAFQGLQQQSALVNSGDVRTISDWMTIPYIAHTYHVPEDYLYQWLHITGGQKPQHVTLRMLAARYHRSASDLVHSVQAAILAYRNQHPPVKKTPGSRTGTPRTAWMPVMRVILLPCEGDRKGAPWLLVWYKNITDTLMGRMLL